MANTSSMSVLHYMLNFQCNKKKSSISILKINFSLPNSKTDLDLDKKVSPRLAPDVERHSDVAAGSAFF